MVKGSLYSIAVAEITTILRDEMSVNDGAVNRITVLSNTFGRQPLSILTRGGYQDILDGIDVLTPSLQSYITNLVARITIHLRMSMYTPEDIDNFTALIGQFSTTVNELDEMALFDDNITARLDNEVVAAGGAVIMYLIATAHRGLMISLSREG